MATIVQGAPAPVLSFHSTTFHPVVREGQLWLTAAEIAQALGYARGTFVNRLYDRNADEFTDAMQGVVNLTTNGGEQKTRVFSLRGAHLVAMFARTPRAAEFRRWLLDVLDREVASMPVVVTPVEPEKLGPPMGDRTLRLCHHLIDRLEPLFREDIAAVHGAVMQGVLTRFGCDAVADIPASQEPRLRKYLQSAFETFSYFVCAQRELLLNYLRHIDGQMDFEWSVDCNTRRRMERAMDVVEVEDVFADFGKHAPRLPSPAKAPPAGRTRYLTTVDPDEGGSVVMKPVPDGAFVRTPEQIVDLIEARDGFPHELLVPVIQAATRRLSQR
ncbi:MAG: hypothetical protein CGU28_16900 [Candidatus Dactylopiibacterium carminicum]|uniref:Bro-N domain-containing protein n=1 Tax=Candidatus Dactylopiibacterium carminicum TaxID=857335 RepID=A0A272EMP6_9RHOO|nr:Bro-N domain-containing protein [Candidatus Dactylopiibacterium carminicum]KAF7597743.1 hypothetical protein BGI27_17085 [Candidatus Dactylopiibacterium carminicum]PAS91346.1 MAG: hypothetical protein CGU29_16985 [Candidatus Dactylopiibacterium carminicum]PAS92238.1 MAG: hypothetical protein CGU28_16900 [Candidatus Dactylopiibacterium carminicum]PAS95014.1 MAG: hypothetical protein BSR46_17125 [Candidatus Dactylopiibacterium carminicum]